MNKLFASMALSTTLLNGVYALDVKPLMENKIEVNSNDKLLSSKGVDNALDDIYEDQYVNEIKLTKKQIHEARVWGLSHEEEKRYVALMENRAKSYYKGIKHSPIDILGINARNDSERNRYAKLAAEHDIVRVAKELAWNSAFTNQTEIVSNHQNIIADFDTSKYSPQNQKQYVLSDGDVLHLFLKKDDASMTLMSSILDAINIASNSKLIIYLVDAENDDAQLWANRNAIPLDLVQQQRITMKIGPDNFNALGLNNNKTPLLLLTREGQSKVISFGGRNA